tara:strand:- start:1882 stop:2172 length:291 start_codon:yes stop_codon:yes gene_type:complete
MNSVINKDTGKIDGWFLRCQNIFNNVYFDIEENPEELPPNFKNGWNLKLRAEDFVTSSIVYFDMSEGYVITNSNFKYYLGEPKNNSLWDVLNLRLN